MYVTYKTYKDNKLIDNYKNTSCFSELFNNQWDKMELLLYESSLSKGQLKFWFDFVKKIEPKIKLREDNYCIIPYQGKGKTLTLVTILRFLWEDINHYDTIIPLTKEVIKLVPDIDEMGAVVLASSITHECDGWGHSLVNAVATKIPRKWHYRRYKGNSIFGLTALNDHDSSSYKNRWLLNRLRTQKETPLDVKPILKHFNIPYNEQ
jgi:hypothetical protein